MRIIRTATEHDAAAFAAIYEPIVLSSAISFETVPPDAQEFARRLGSTMPTYPWLVAEDNGSVVGYAYGGRHRARPAYQWSVETSVYVDKAWRAQGVGRSLYSVLFELLRRQGFANAFAGITLPNDASIGLHRAFGFEEIGVYNRVGFKNSRWHDVWWGGLDLAPERTESVHPPQTVEDLRLTTLESIETGRHPANS